MSLNSNVAQTPFQRELLHALWRLGGRASISQIAERFKMNEDDVTAGFDCLVDAVVRIKDETYELGIRTEDGYIPEVVLVQFGRALHRYGEDSVQLVFDVLVPKARQKGMTLIDAAWDHADDGADQDTSYYQLYMALLSVPGYFRATLAIYGKIV